MTSARDILEIGLASSAGVYGGEKGSSAAPRPPSLPRKASFPPESERSDNSLNNVFSEESLEVLWVAVFRVRVAAKRRYIQGLQRSDLLHNTSSKRV